MYMYPPIRQPPETIGNCDDIFRETLIVKIKTSVMKLERSTLVRVSDQLQGHSAHTGR